MRWPTVIISVGLHVGLAVGLVAVAQKRELRRRAISVAVQDEKKKAKPPKPPAPPKPIAHPAIAKVEPVAPKATSVSPVAHAAAARGVKRFRATMLADNIAIQRLTTNLAAGPLKRRQLGSISEVEIELAAATDAATGTPPGAQRTGPGDPAPAIIAACAGS